MRTITINVSEPVYREFQEYARRQDRKAAELIREAMELYRSERIAGKGGGSVAAMASVSVGRVLRALDADDDLPGEMINL